MLVYTHKDYLTLKIQQQLLNKVRGLEFDADFVYKRGLDSQLAAKLPISSYFDLVGDEGVYESIRQYNYQLSCKGRKVHKGHNYELARMLFQK